MAFCSSFVYFVDRTGRCNNNRLSWVRYSMAKIVRKDNDEQDDRSELDS